MSKRKAIDQLNTTEANSIYWRFIAPYQKGSKTPDDKEMRTLARGYLREQGITPKQAIAKPLPK